uniref:NEL-type E3 ubiquitin ligase domain-containing protein n=1 Tax=Bordetella sputigena TaxID=1416810 RepID=UPI0039F111F2
MTAPTRRASRRPAADVPPTGKAGATDGNEARIITAAPIRLSPDAAQMTRFMDELVQRMDGVSSPGHAASIKDFLRRMEGDDRGGMILRALAAYREIKGKTPRLALRRDVSQTVMKRPNWWRHHTEWRVRADLFGQSDIKLAAQCFETIYMDLANMRGMGVENDATRAIRENRIPVDPELEAAWTQWVAQDDQVPEECAGERAQYLRQRRATRARVVERLRARVQQARFYGGVDEDTFNEAVHRRTPYPSNGSHITLRPQHLGAGVPPLPADLLGLELAMGSDSILDRFPAGLRTLVIKGSAPAAPAIALPAFPDTLHSVAIFWQKVTEVPRRLPSELRELGLYGCDWVRLPALSTTLTALVAPSNRLTELPAPLPAGLEILEVLDNQLVSLPPLPGTIRSVNVARNRMTRLPWPIPDSAVQLDFSSNLITEVPDYFALINAAIVHIHDNPIDLARLRRLDALVGSSFQLLYDLPRPRQGTPLAYALRSVLGEEHADAIGRWQEIERGAAPGSDTASNLAEFARYLDQVRLASAYRNPAFREDIRDLVIELSKPDRQSLRDAVLHVCEGVRRICRDRAAWAMTQIRKARLTDDILLGRYDDRVGEVIEISRQMFCMDALIGIARTKAAGMSMEGEELEVYLYLAVKLRPRDKLDLSIMLPEMDHGAMVKLDDRYLADTLRAVQEHLRAAFDPFFVTQYEPWQRMLERRYGERYEQARASIAVQVISPEFRDAVAARMAANDMPKDDEDARRATETALAGELQYAVLQPLTVEYLQSAGVSYTPRLLPGDPAINDASTG